MVYLFHKHVFLCNFTTAIIYFLQVTYVSSTDFSSDRRGVFYNCDDKRIHFLANKVYYLKSSQEASASTAPIAAIYVEKAGTIVNASQVTVYGDNPDKTSAYGAYVRNGGRLNLAISNFKDIPALCAQDAVISMTLGEIKGTSHAIYAWGRGANIALESVNIDIEPNNSNVKSIGIMSGFGAMVRMSDGTVNFNQIGSFSTLFEGRYFLDNIGIMGQGRREESGTGGDSAMGGLPEAFEVFQGGDVYLKNGFFQLNSMHAFLIKNFSGYVNDNSRLIQRHILPNGFKNTNIKIEKNNISVKGEGAHGLYFNVLASEEFAKMLRQRDDEKNLETKKVITGRAFVHLSETNMTVPDGIAIYAKGNKDYGVKGTLELSDETKISGDLLLKAENNASLLVKANSSFLKGGTRVEDRSVIDLELVHYSKWYLTKSKYNGLQESVSSLSSLHLSNSTLIFDEDSGYQTLRIGKKTNIDARDNISDSIDKKVYSAEGNAQIRLNAFLSDEGLFDSQKTDRILIYGDVSGTTFIRVQNFPKYASKEVYEGRDQSISLIQVAGTAQAGSFRLANGYDDYTTVKGFPYQYRIRGYGPGSPFGEANATQRLVEGEGDFWDFRLEGIYISSRLGSYNGPFGKPSPFSLSYPVDSPPPDPLPTLLMSDSPSSESSAPVDPPPPDPLSTSFMSDSPFSESSAPVDPPPPDPLSTSFMSDSPFSESSAPVDPPSPDLLSTSFISSPPSSASSDPVDPLLPDSLPTSLPSEPPVPVVPSATDSDPVSPPSDAVEPKPSTSSDALKPSSNLPMPLDVQPELGIRAVVPQLPTYLLLPNALFHAGLMDMTTQNKKLETMRGVFHSSWKEDENTAFFLRAYGGSHHYASNLSAFEYGYGAELDYNAFQAGVLLNEIESLYTRTFFGALGNYGNLSLHPQNVEQSKKSAFHKWSVGAYGSLQHDTGFYMDGVLSYGLFKGDVLTLARGKVVALKGKQFSGSLTSGRTFAIGDKGVVFDPQVQIVYQYLQFHQALDVDNLDVDLGKFHQWMGRVGGRLSKTLGISEKGREVSFYSKLSYLHSFEDKQFVSFKNDFQLGSFGSSLEAGLGFDARLSSKLSLHGDVTYQHRLKKVGFSGAHFSAGLRHLF
ncbi:autotransporter outer membrane beta-barrel domain-containing protein [Bartonella tribocorum]|uniref:Autotransporter n=1 Tax=Bartonella tribocorum (strain DSM 28219 / CCUG 45778 / CIP 105476 / IBS 506) TaxID=382640 RepID=A9IWY4_BART1|nr:autotransporter outer membrane beta-barrel domain-containing protein [Bartonella tribocorum]CAK02068.1 autotransporter [Bartonella tribocorum CIP 105476]CDO49332.1 autotransporter [Bartonella tribocorum]